MTTAARFNQADVTRAYRGAVKGGMSVQRIEICPATGRIVIVAGAPFAASVSVEPNEWDDELNEHG